MISEHPLIQKLISLKLPTNDYAIFGSGAMFVHGIKDLGHDIDIVARGSAWEKAITLGTVAEAPMGANLMIQFFSEEIEIFNGWVPGEWDINELIDTAEVHDGIRFVNLQKVLEWKKRMGREKDLAHIQLIEEYLNHGCHKVSCF